MAKAAKKPPKKTPKKSATTERPETHRIVNLKPSLATEDDWEFQHAAAAGALAAPAALPASVDLRAAWWDVGDQKNTGACVGWASTEGVARYMLVKANKLAKNEKLSPRFTWMASKETDQATTLPETMLDCAGTFLKAAADILRNFGAVPDSMCPFIITSTMYTGPEKDFFATAATRKIASYFNLQRNLANWKAWLASTGPILVGLNVDATWDNASNTGGNLDTFQPNTVRGGHAVCIVGYRPDGRFIVRNSWNTTWGDKGFAYASPSYIDAAFFPESYGMTVQAIIGPVLRMAEHHFSQPDNGAVVDASVGDVIELGMGESASGGYRWTVASAPTDTVDAAAPTYEFEAGKVGGSSVAHFRFTVKSAGSSTIRLEYKRPWEEGEPPLRTFEMTVEVR